MACPYLNFQCHAQDEVGPFRFFSQLVTLWVLSSRHQHLQFTFG